LRLEPATSRAGLDEICRPTFDRRPSWYVKWETAMNPIILPDRIWHFAWDGAIVDLLMIGADGNYVG